MKRLKELREAKGFATVDALAEQCGLNRSYLYALEAGTKSAGPGALARLSLYYGCTIGQVRGTEPAPDWARKEGAR